MSPTSAEAESNLCFVAFALSDCIVETDPRSAKYLRAVHRTALELATANCFGLEAGGFWLTMEQIAELRKLSDYYPLVEADAVTRAIESYLQAQLQGLYSTMMSRPDPTPL